MHIHPAAGCAAVLFLSAGIAIAVRGELRARELEQRREEILLALPDRAREIKSQLLNRSLDAKAKEELEDKLEDCKRGVTGIPRHFAGNERKCGYGLGVGLAAMGFACLWYKPKVQP